MNAFNGSKVLYHIPYWAQMERGVVPPPVLVTIDPIGACNLRCEWCNGKSAMERAPGRLSEAQIDALGPALAEWGTRAVCIAGGGEPTMHPQIGRLISGLVDAGVQVGVVTNGTLLDRVPEIARCRWVGVSVDAGSRETYRLLKGLDRFEDVIEGMRSLRKNAPKLELTYKFLVSPGNVRDLSAAASAAVGLGCYAFHARPAGLSWSRIAAGESGSLFMITEAREAQAEMSAVRRRFAGLLPILALSDAKFTADGWAPRFPFSRCMAVGMTCVINATEVGLCCDRRGDELTKLCDWTVPADFIGAWGRTRHLSILGAVDLSACPRCTYAPHNELYEQFVCTDPHCKDFI